MSARMRAPLSLYVIAVVVASNGVRVAAQDRPAYEYGVLATSRTSTMESELNRAAEAAGYGILGMTARTASRGRELVAIVRRLE